MDSFVTNERSYKGLDGFASCNTSQVVSNVCDANLGNFNPNPIALPKVGDHLLSFNLEAALSNLGGDQDLLFTLATMFAEDVPAEVQDIVTAYLNKNWSDVQLHAHTLKGLCATFSAEPLRGMAHELELGAKHRESTTKLGGLVAEIQSLMQSTIYELQATTEAFKAKYA